MTASVAMVAARAALAVRDVLIPGKSRAGLPDATGCPAASVGRAAGS
jgi:hypothetical protein